MKQKHIRRIGRTSPGVRGRRGIPARVVEKQTGRSCKEARIFLRALRDAIRLEVRVARNDVPEKLSNIEKTLEIIARELGRHALKGK